MTPSPHRSIRLNPHLHHPFPRGQSAAKHPIEQCRRLPTQRRLHPPHHLRPRLPDAQHRPLLRHGLPLQRRPLHPRRRQHHQPHPPPPSTSTPETSTSRTRPPATKSSSTSPHRKSKTSPPSRPAPQRLRPRDVDEPDTAKKKKKKKKKKKTTPHLKAITIPPNQAVHGRVYFERDLSTTPQRSTSSCLSQGTIFKFPDVIKP